jgi:hypothetical protein
MAQSSQPLTVYVTKNTANEPSHMKSTGTNEKCLDQVMSCQTDQYQQHRPFKTDGTNEMQTADFPYLDSPASLSSFNGNPLSPFSLVNQVSPHMSEDDESYANDLNSHLSTIQHQNGIYLTTEPLSIDLVQS